MVHVQHFKNQYSSTKQTYYMEIKVKGRRKQGSNMQPSWSLKWMKIFGNEIFQMGCKFDKALFNVNMLTTA